MGEIFLKEWYDFFDPANSWPFALLCSIVTAVFFLILLTCSSIHYKRKTNRTASFNLKDELATPQNVYY
ncbi:unnamed protein product, partial [Mesorhabditis belari]|uniref:Uncharacterized protein n=1 Tax=Mesorhabditis belari TaxID=2138241 RepID=A0AAF3F632_9BILA